MTAEQRTKKSDVETLKTKLYDYLRLTGEPPDPDFANDIDALIAAVRADSPAWQPIEQEKKDSSATRSRRSLPLDSVDAVAASHADERVAEIMDAFAALRCAMNHEQESASISRVIAAVRADERAKYVPPPTTETLPNRTVTVERFIHWCETTPNQSLTGNSRVAYDAQMRVLRQLAWYLEGTDDYLIAAVNWNWENKPRVGSGTQAASAERADATRRSETPSSSSTSDAVIGAQQEKA